MQRMDRESENHLHNGLQGATVSETWDLHMICQNGTTQAWTGWANFVVSQRSWGQLKILLMDESILSRGWVTQRNQGPTSLGFQPPASCGQGGMCQGLHTTFLKEDEVTTSMSSSEVDLPLWVIFDSWASHWVGSLRS